MVFDDDDENKLEYMTIYNAFREMVDALLESHLGDMGVSVQDFTQLCQSNPTHATSRGMVGGSTSPCGQITVAT